MRKKTAILVVLLAAFLCIASLSPVASAQWQEYYVLGDEATSLLCAYENMSYGEPSGHVNGTVSIVAWEPVHVTVDKDENGYAGSDLTQDLGTGEIWTLDTSDLGGDYIRANGSISIVRTAWWFNATAVLGWPGTFVAGTWEVYPTESWGTNYVVPIDTPYTQLIVQAKEDNTDVTVGAGPVVTLNRGEDRHFANVTAGTTITATKPIQAGIVTNKDLGIGYGWDTRYFTLTPKKLLGNDYYIPVPSFATYHSESGAIHGTLYVPTNLTVYAFNDNTQVWIETTAGGITPLTLDAGEKYTYTMPQIASYYPNIDPMTGPYAAHIYADDTIWVLGSCDDNDDDFDWGFQGVNTSVLGAEYYVPWSPANPAYVTPIANATFYVDLDADGTEEYQFDLNRLNMRMIYPNNTIYKVDPLNLTGAKIWTNDAVPFAIMWGQDNNEDTPGERPTSDDPDNDFGYTVLYVPVYKAPEPGTWDGFVYEDPDCNCTYDQGEVGVPNVTVWLYNATTGVRVNTTTTDGSGHYLFTNVTPGPYWARYNMSDLPLNLSPKCDDDTNTTGSEVDKVTSDDNSVPVDGAYRHNFAVESTADVGIEKLVDGFEMERVVHNQNITYTLTITNTGDVNLTNITVVDLLPAAIIWADAADPVEDSVTNNANGTTTIVWKNNITVYPFEPGDLFVISFNATVNESAAYTELHKNRATVNATSDWGNVSDKGHADVFIDPQRVPVLTPFGIAALIGLLSLVVVYSISKGVRRKKG